MLKRLFLMLSILLFAKDTRNKLAADKVNEVITEVNIGGDEGSGKVVILKLRSNEINVENKKFAFKARLITFKTKFFMRIWKKLGWGVLSFWPVSWVSMGTGIIVGYVWGCIVWY